MKDKTSKRFEDVPIGEPFSQTYLKPSAPLQDSPRFRRRLAAYLINNLPYGSDLPEYLEIEAGLETPTKLMRGLEFLFMKEDIGNVLTVITHIWRYLQQEHFFSMPLVIDSDESEPAQHWREFVLRALIEQHMAYTVDEKCGVHFFVDEEFERNRLATLQGLSQGRFGAVRDALESSYGFLDRQPPNTKEAVRAAFEALETLSRTICGNRVRLTRRSVQDHLTPLVIKNAADEVERETIQQAFNGIGALVDGLHSYRHGQPGGAAAKPTLPTAVYAFASINAVIRWLVDAEQRNTK